MMKLVGGEVMGFLSPDAGVLCLLIIVILSIVLSTLCLDCGRRSFELRDPDVEKNPSTLVRVVKLEEAMAASRVNPMINEMQNDEMESTTSESGPEDNSWYQPWRSHLQSPDKSEPFTTVDVAEPHILSSLPPSTTAFTSTLDTEGSTKALTSTLNPEGPLESLCLGAGQNQEPPESPEVHPQHIYDIIAETESVGGGRGGTPWAEMEISSHELYPDSAAVHELVHSSVEEAQEGSSDREWNPMYAQVSKKSKCLSPPPIPSPGDKEKVQDEEEEHVSPSLPEKGLVE